MENLGLGGQQSGQTPVTSAHSNIAAYPMPHSAYAAPHAAMFPPGAYYPIAASYQNIAVRFYRKIFCYCESTPNIVPSEGKSELAP